MGGEKIDHVMLGLALLTPKQVDQYYHRSEDFRGSTRPKRGKFFPNVDIPSTFAFILR